MEATIVSAVVALFAAFLGAIVGGFFTVRAARESFAESRLQAKAAEDLLVKSLKQAIHDEITALWEIYNVQLGPQLENLHDGYPFLYIFPVSQDYCPVYKGNTANIGRIQDPALRKAIVSTYTFVFGMIDSIRLNNDLVNKFTGFQKSDNCTPEEQRLKQIAEHQCKSYGPLLKVAHLKLKAQYQILVTELLNDKSANPP